MPSKISIEKWRTLLCAVADFVGIAKRAKVVPARSGGDETRARLAGLGIVEQDVAAAVSWARDGRKF